MGMRLEEGRAGGASDGNITSLSTPTLDGLGCVGDGAHAVHEYVDMSRSVERCALLASLLLLPREPSSGRNGAMGGER
jgi:glutamate carboxypeptidase